MNIDTLLQLEDSFQDNFGDRQSFTREEFLAAMASLTDEYERSVTRIVEELEAKAENFASIGSADELKSAIFETIQAAIRAEEDDSQREFEELLAEEVDSESNIH